MPSLLHPCQGCGHQTMDECWSAAQRMLSGHKRLCLECHDECLAKADDHPPGVAPTRPTPPPPSWRPGGRW